MKKLLIILALFFACQSMHAQNESGQAYLGMGLGLTFFTNSDVWNMYPVVDVNGNGVTGEISPYFGINISNNVSIEFAPSFTIQKTYSKNGYYYSDKNINNYYVPQNVSFVMIPLIAKVKHFPFSQTGYRSKAVTGIFYSAGVGGAFIGESYDMYVYTDETKTVKVGNGLLSKSNNVFVPMGQLSIGYEYPMPLSFGVEAGYKFIPTNLNRETPLVSSWAANFNNFFLNLKVKYTFQ